MLNRILILSVTFFCFVLSAGEIECQMDKLHLFFSPWEISEDFTVLNFKGPLASQAFSDLGPSDSDLFKVILKKDWCRPLQDALICETPSSALVELEASQSSSTASTHYLLRYFITIIQYRKDGWAFLKIRAKREDDQPPITFHTEFPAGSCKSPEMTR